MHSKQPWCRWCAMRQDPKHRCTRGYVGPFGDVVRRAVWHRSLTPPKIERKHKHT